MTPSDKRARTDPYNRGFPDVISADDKDNYSQEVRKKIFETLFRLKFRVRVAPQGEDLNRECSLFTEDFRYLIVGSATYVQDDYAQPGSQETYRTNESVEPNPRFPLEDYSIHIVDLKHGTLSDSKSFKADRIFLSHNQGLYLYNNTLAVLSVQHQTITIFHVDNGQFWPIRTIGKFCYEDDELLYSCKNNNYYIKLKIF
jgi:de-etiolated-1